MTSDGERDKLPALLVLTSTYPRWSGDPEPGFVHELAKRLTNRFRVTVLAPHAPGARTTEILDGVDIYRYRYAPARMETLVNDGGIIANLRRSKWKWLLVPTFILAQVWHGWRIIRGQNTAVIHAHWLIPQGLAAVILRRLPGCRIPFVITSHGADLFSLRGRIPQWLKRVVMRDAGIVTVVSEAMRERAKEICPGAGDVRVRPMGVDLRHQFAPDTKTPRSEDELLFVGRLVEKKGLCYLLDAMPSVLARRPGTHLSVAGFGPEEATLKDQARALGIDDHVNFLGPVTQADLPELYRRSAALVAPFVETESGDQEGLGLVVVEAAGCECPVLAGDVPAVRDVLGHTPTNLVDPRSKVQLSNAILRVLDGPHHAQADARTLRECLIERFDWQNVARDYFEFLADITSSPARSTLEKDVRL